MFIFTSRELENRAGQPAAEPKLAADSARLALASLEHAAQTPAAGWKVSHTDSDVDDAESMQALLPLFQGAGPLLVYLHGYNSTPAACFERCDRLQSLYGVEIVRFSWSSSRKCPPEEGGQPGLAAARPPFGSRLYLPLNDGPRLLDAVAGDPDGRTCSWWLLMAMPGSPPVH
ncbi:MAG: hypothetical protein JWP96_81 [Polaromonas sp.]|nr:hypothetical protein [Polaromonas sp.]